MKGATEKFHRQGSSLNGAPQRQSSGIDLSTLSSTIGFNVRLLDLRLMKLFGERLAAFNLTPAEMTVMQIINTNPGVRHGDLAEALLIQPPNMTKLLNQLEVQGFLRRHTSDDDRRHIVLSLTAKGRRLAIRIQEAILDHEALVLAALQPADREILIGLVRRALDSLDTAART
jgi:DNA-binding MarR family transcriptional regulator